MLLLDSRDARPFMLVVVNRTVDGHQHLLHLHFVGYGVTAGIDRRQVVGVCLSLSLVSDVDWALMNPVVPHATLVVDVLRHDGKLIAVGVVVSSGQGPLLAVLGAREEGVEIRCGRVLLLVMRVVQVEVQVHIHIDRVVVVTVAVAGRIA